LTGFDQNWMKAIVEKIDSLEARVWKLEDKLMLESNTKTALKTSNVIKGPSGAIGKLMQEGFLDQPKTSREVETELNRQGYYYDSRVIHTALTRDFMKRKQLLTRIGKKGDWRFVVRK
jgi:hypothetical protein